LGFCVSHRFCPGGPGFTHWLGSLVWSADGLPSTRNWPSFQCPPATHQPAPGDTQTQTKAVVVSRQLAGAVVLGGGAAPAPPLAGSGRSCASSIRVRALVSKTRGAQAFRRGAGRLCTGCLGYLHCSRGGAEEESRCFFTRLYKSSCSTYGLQIRLDLRSEGFLRITAGQVPFLAMTPPNYSFLCRFLSQGRIQSPALIPEKARSSYINALAGLEN
jgi:hypothetical protein